MINPEFRIIAHRGASAHCRENTLDSFEMAADMGAKWVELDTQVTIDGHPVVFHDIGMFRSTGSRGAISKKTLAQVLHVALPGGLAIPTLKEVCDAMEKRGVGVYVEIKSASGVGVAEIISVVKSMKTPAVVSAFDHSKLEQIKKQAPDMRLMALFKQPTRQMVRICREIGAQEAGIAYRQANSDMAKRFVDASIPLFCYTVNKPKLFEEARKMGLSGVFTDYPGLALASMGAKTA